MKSRIWASFFLLFSAYWLLAAGIEPRLQQPVYKNQGFLPFAEAPINYRSADVDDPIARLNAKLESGKIHLAYDAKHGYLPAVLDALHIPVSSQALVFSKTSFQFPLIAPATPRALYYNDDVYVGEVPNAKFLEFASFDPKQGAIFYVLDARQAEQPRFERAATDCTQCHVADATKGIPGVMVRSVFTRASGAQAGGSRSFVTGQESPWAQRWGGWYVTAHVNPEPNMGNALVLEPEKPEQLTRFHELGLPTEETHLGKNAYLANTSDVVAQMVLAHQTQMHNLITLANYDTRLAADNSNPRRRPHDFKESAEQLVRYLLFTNEVPLTGPVEGDSTFAKDFSARGPFDSQGRSLRQFDLKTRLFHYPCSYLIYSETFDAIPEPAKGYVLHRLFEVLSGKDQSAAYNSLSAEDRRAIFEILVETKPGLPEEWRKFQDQSRQQTAVVRATPR